jgi:hypothetical protein
MNYNNKNTKENLYQTISLLVINKFPKTKLHINEYDHYSEIQDYDFNTTRHQLPDEIFIIKLSNYMTETISYNYSLKLADSNNVRSFIDKHLSKNNKEYFMPIREEYTTMRKFCKDNSIYESEMKKILLTKGYYNNVFKFMPSRKALEKDEFRPKAYSTIYNISVNKNVNMDNAENFFINWEHQFLRNMMLKYYDEQKIKENKQTNKKPESLMRYIIPKNVEEALDKIGYVSSIIENIFHNENYDEIMENYELLAAHRNYFEVILENEFHDYIVYFNTYKTKEIKKQKFSYIENNLIKAFNWSRSYINEEQNIKKYTHYLKLFYRFLADFKRLL